MDETATSFNMKDFFKLRQAILEEQVRRGILQEEERCAVFSDNSIWDKYAGDNLTQENVPGSTEIQFRFIITAVVDFTIRLRLSEHPTAPVGRLD